MSAQPIGRFRTLALGAGALLLVVAVLLAVQSAPSARAGHLPANGDFDSDLQGWTENGSVWDAMDVNGSGSSGSALVSATGSIAVISQCMGTVVPGGTYNLAASVYIDQAAPAGHTVTAKLQFFFAPGCFTNPTPPEELTDSTSVYGPWQTLSVSGVAPDGAMSVGILFQAPLSDPPQFEFYLDAVTMSVVSPPPPTRTPTASPTAEVTATLTATIEPTTATTTAPTTTTEPTPASTATTGAEVTPKPPATGSGKLDDGRSGAWTSTLAVAALAFMLAGGIAVTLSRSRS